MIGVAKQAFDWRLERPGMYRKAFLVCSNSFLCSAIHSTQRLFATRLNSELVLGGF